MSQPGNSPSTPRQERPVVLTHQRFGWTDETLELLEVFRVAKR